MSVPARSRLDEERVGHELAQCAGPMVAGAVSKQRAQEGDVDIDEPFGCFLDGDVGTKRSSIGEALQEPRHDRGRQGCDRLWSSADPCKGGGGSLTFEDLEPRFGPYGGGVREETVDDHVGRVGVVVDVGLEAGGDLRRTGDKHFPDELVLVGDVSVHRGPRAASPAGDLVHPHRERSVLFDHFGGGVYQASSQVDIRCCYRHGGDVSVLVRQMSKLS